ncbi:phage tail protein [Rhodopseudomonas sp.]|uniref:phage tail protein n=1 Tax=Rhodopseudomonas sp. TaxID=1078 RepID=UPI003B3B2094
MAIFTAIFGAIASAIGLTGFFATAFVAVGVLATSVGISYLLRKKPEQASQSAESHFSAQGQLQAAGDVPRSFIVGYSFTAGSLVYANEWGNDGDTPNAYHVQVIALADLPSGPLREVWVNGELCTLLSGEAHGEFGVPLAQYRKDGKDHLWIKYYDGRQTAADPYLVNRVSSADYPYEATRVGFGVAYVICTALVEDTLFAGFPSYKFVPGSIPLYDPSKDTTAGGDGPQRWSDPSTWGGDGDDLPVVQAYNILRGINYGGAWFYGAQRMSAPRLPITNWLVQIAKCRSGVEGENGIEPAYRSGGQISVDQAPLDIISKLNSTCQGRLTEVGGFYKYHAGAPDSPSFSWTDADLLSTEEHTFQPFFSLDRSTNGVQARYPDPEQGWSVITAPAYHRPDLEARDGGRRLMATPLLDFVPYAAQVQRLQKSAIDEARRARTHELAFPPAFWLAEPGDVGQWTSTRNGYSAKLFRVDGMTDHANLDVTMAVTEVDPADYDWNHETDYQGVTIGPTTFVRPAPQGTLSWLVEPYVERDASGLERRPCIRLAWDGTLAGISGVAYRVREAESEDIVVSNQTPFYAEGAIIIRGLLPETDYEVEARLIPTAPRDIIPSDWMPVTTPDVRLSPEELVAGIRYQMTTLQNQVKDALTEIEARSLEAAAKVAARGLIDKEIFHQESADGQASVTELAGTVSDLDHAFAGYQLQVDTQIGEVASAVQVTAAALSELDTSVAQYKVETESSIGDLSSSVTTQQEAIARLDGYTQSRYSVKLNANGAAAGFELIAGGGGTSAFIIEADKWQWQQPGVNGGAPVPIMTAGTIGGVPSWGFRGNMYLDGTMNVSALNTATLTAFIANLDYINSGYQTSPSGKMVAVWRESRIEFYR